MKWQKKYFGVGAECVHWWNRDFAAKSGFLGHKSGLAIFAAILTLGGSACGVFGASSVFAEGLTLTIPETLKLDVNPDLANAGGTFGKSTKPSELFASTTTAFGFNLSLKVKDAANGNKLMKGEKSIPSIESKLTEEAYQGAGNVNTWAYLPSKLAGVANTEYQPGPTTQTVIEETDAANGPELPNSYQMSLAAKINSETEPGTYQNTFVFTLTANSTKYNLVFDLNPAGEASGGPTNISGDSVEATKTVQIGSEVPTREGYEFKGWCTEKTSDENCGGQTIAAGGNYTFNGLKKGNDNTVTLWAMWYTKYGPTTMQGWKGCDQLQTNQTITLTDARDNNQYTVAKLLDGKCWMTQNLRLANGNSIMLTSEDTDVDKAFTLLASDASNFKTPQQANTYFRDRNFGTYFNMFSMTAGEGWGRNNQNINSSICPKNWKLPTILEFSELGNFYNYNPSILSTPYPGFTLGGILESSGTLSNDNYYAYGSSTVNPNGTSATFFYGNSTTQILCDYNHSCGYSVGRGFPVRCFKRAD